MVATRELMLGNILSTKEDGLCVVASINIKGEVRCKRVNSEKFAKKYIPSFTELHPIPLTPEILEKCGFHLAAGGGRHEFTKECKKSRCFMFHVPTSRWHFGVELSSVNRMGITMVSSLHQLQNLYFALTGTELKINL